MATVPQKPILSIPLVTLDPPVFAAIAPRNIRKIMEKPYCKYTISFTGAKMATKSGKAAPEIKEKKEATAAYKGFATVISLIPNSSFAWASNASWSESSLATNKAVSLETPRLS